MTGFGIEAVGLTRRFGRGGTERTVLHEVSFVVPYGRIVGLLGPNGAGKTTCIRILTTQLLPTLGTATVAGADVLRGARDVRRAVGVAYGGDSGLYTRLSGRDNLRYFGTMYGLYGRRLDLRVADLLERVDLADRQADRVEVYSHGMRQRLHIARALLHDPPVLLLDEPSRGLDPEQGQRLRELVLSLRDEDRAVLLTTHDLTEAELLCNEAVILNRGRVVRGATVRSLKAEAAHVIGHRIELETTQPIHADVIDAVPGVVRHLVVEPNLVRIHTTEPVPATAFLMTRLAGKIVGIHVQPPSLEEAYLDTVAVA